MSGGGVNRAPVRTRRPGRLRSSPERERSVTALRTRAAGRQRRSSMARTRGDTSAATPLCTDAGAVDRPPEILFGEDKDGPRAEGDGRPPEVPAGKVAEARPLEIIARPAGRPVFGEIPWRPGGLEHVRCDPSVSGQPTSAVTPLLTPGHSDPPPHPRHLVGSVAIPTAPSPATGQGSRPRGRVISDSGMHHRGRSSQARRRRHGRQRSSPAKTGTNGAPRTRASRRRFSPARWRRPGRWRSPRTRVEDRPPETLTRPAARLVFAENPARPPGWSTSAVIPARPAWRLPL